MNKIVIVLFIVVLSACSGRKDSIIYVSTPSQSASGEPYLYTDSSGTVFLSWVETIDSVNYLKFSTLENEQWTAPRVITSGKDWFVNWADYPMLVTNNHEMIAHFLEKSGAGKFAYDVKVTSSHDGGNSWMEPKTIHDDGLAAEHGFVSMIPYGDNFFISWLDGRNTVMEGMEHHEGHHGQMSLRGAIVDNQGNKSNEWELDNRTCDCCQTTAVITANGPVVVYRDRSEDEIRDMSIVRFVNNAWTAPKAIYNDQWKIAGCPVNGPRADAIGNDLAIAWYSLTNGEGNVKVIFSSDGGETFDEPIRVDEGKTIGRVDIVMIDSNTVMVSWMEGATIKARKINRNGESGKSFTVASTTEARSSGFPQMTKWGEKIVFAWTDDQDKQIKSAILN